MSYRRFRGSVASATVATVPARGRPDGNEKAATVATFATVGPKIPEVSQLSQVSQGVSFQAEPNDARTVATVAELEADEEDWFAAFDERAGFLEFDCHLSRDEAERLAHADTRGRLGFRVDPMEGTPNAHINLAERAVRRVV